VEGSCVGGNDPSVSIKCWGILKIVCTTGGFSSTAELLAASFKRG
jgi:hypothetical protein